MAALDDDEAVCICGHSMEEHMEGFDCCTMCECNAFDDLLDSEDNGRVVERRELKADASFPSPVNPIRLEDIPTPEEQKAYAEDPLNKPWTDKY